MLISTPICSATADHGFAIQLPGKRSEGRCGRDFHAGSNAGGLSIHAPGVEGETISPHTGKLSMTSNNYSSPITLLSTGLLSLGMLVLLLAGCNTSREYIETKEFDGMRLTMASPQGRFELGEMVVITVVLENISEQVITLERSCIPDCPYAFDIQIEELWLSELNPELQVEQWELGPGEKIEVSHQFLPEQKIDLLAINVYISYRNGTRNERFLIEYGPIPRP